MIPQPWLRHYDDAVPASLQPYPPTTLVDAVADAARERPEHPALLFKGSVITYGQLDRLSTAFAAELVAEGVRKGDRVALLLPNCPQFVIAQFGIWKAGGIVAPVNPIYTERELSLALSDSGAGIAVVLTRLYDRFKAVQSGTSVRRVIATNIKEYLPRWTALLFTLLREKKEGHRITLAQGDRWWRDVLASGSRRPPVAEKPLPTDPAVLLCSGGTTGTPKAAIGAHRVYTQAGLQLRAWTGSVFEKYTDVILLPLPLFHVYANVGVQGLAIVGHNPIALVPNPRDIDDLLKSIRKVRPAFFAGVPTLFNAILNHPSVGAGRVDFGSIKICFSGASALLAETRRRFVEMTSGHIVEGYSLTEGMMACILNPVQGVAKNGSIGMPLPDVNIQIVDADDSSRALGPNQVGELIIQAPQLMAGYWGNPGETSGVLRQSADGDTWLHTGDIGYMDDDGYVYLVDRKKDLIKTSGFQVWPREIEEVLAGHPSVVEVAAAGVADAVKGEVVKAWVVLKEGTAASEDDLRRWCRERLAPYKVPATIEFRSELPKSLVGKVLRRALATRQPA
jgi:long-chain acyl-CoA synthetase